MKKRLMIALAALISPVLVHASPDPFVGKWSLDVRNSVYPAGTCPKSMTIDMRPVGNGVRYQSTTTYKNGAIVHAEYTAAYDGKQAMVKTKRGFLLPVTIKRIDARTAEARYSRGFQVVATSRRVVSPDGKTMRITTISKDAEGRTVKTVGFYKRELNAKQTLASVTTGGESRILTGDDTDLHARPQGSDIAKRTNRVCVGPRTVAAVE